MKGLAPLLSAGKHFVLGSCAFLGFLVLVCGPTLAQVPAISDPELRRAVESNLKRHPHLDTSNIMVAAERGVVTLRGTVHSAAAKRNATAVVSRMQGVRMVHNVLEVVPPLKSDAELQRDVVIRLRLNSILKDSQIEVAVADGSIVLGGTVNSLAQLRRAERVAENVHGVQKVVNELVVTASTASTENRLNDDSIQRDVRAALARDAFLANLPLEAGVKAGVVKLSGQVPNLFQRDRAELEAGEIRGVLKVENLIEVESQILLRELSGPVSDEELAKEIRRELELDVRVDTSDIAIRVRDGEVLLSGTVDRLAEKGIAGRLTRNVAGVAEIENQVAVRPAVEREDSRIEVDAMVLLRSDWLMQSFNINVTVEAGRVTLQGKVNSQRAKQRAFRLIASVPGVLEISNQLGVEQQGLGTDDAIREVIERELGESIRTGPVASRIRVVVANGEVTLVGTVDRTDQLLEAGRIARRNASSRTVNNGLQIRR